MDIAEDTFNRFFPTAEELWRRNGADIVDGIPYHDLEIVGDPKEYSVEPLYVRDRFRRRRIGEKILLGYTLSDGTDRMAVARTLRDSHLSEADLLATTSTAWTTRPDSGYAARRDDRIAKEIGLQTASIGPTGSTNERFVSQDVILATSLAKDAQSEQLILQDLSTRFSLPTRHYGMGDSRGAMIKPGHSLYAPMYGNEVVFTDIKAPCVPDKLEIEDLPKVALWLAIEAIGATAVTASLLKDRDIGLLIGTVDFHPRSLPASFMGTMPALMSGEAGRLAELAPADMHGHVVLYGLDILSSVKRWHEIYADKPAMLRKDVPRGSHAHLLHRIGIQISRIERMRDETLYSPTPAQIDWDYIKTGIKKQVDLRLVVNQ